MQRKKQMEFKSTLRSMKIGGNKSDKLLSAIDNITKFYSRREEVIKLYNVYFIMRHKAVFDGKYEKGLKKTTPQQMLQRLPIAIALVKAENTSENLLNEILQIVYPLYRAKEIIDK